MALSINCPHCGAKGSVSEKMIGQNVRCSKCKNAFPITAPAEETTAAFTATAASAAPPPPKPAPAPAAVPAPAPASDFDFGGLSDAPAADSAPVDGGQLPDTSQAPSKPAPSPRTKPSVAARQAAGGVTDFLMFRKMIAPSLLVILFYLVVVLGFFGAGGLAVVGLVSAADMGTKIGALFGSLLGYLLFVVCFRVSIEFMITMFRLYETNAEIRDMLRSEKK